MSISKRPTELPIFLRASCDRISDLSLFFRTLQAKSAHKTTNAKREATCDASPAIMMLIPVCPLPPFDAVSAKAPPAACRTSATISQAMKTKV